MAATFMSSRHPGELHHRTGLCTRCLEIAERTIKSKCRDKEDLQEAERAVLKLTQRVAVCEMELQTAR